MITHTTLPPGRWNFPKPKQALESSANPPFHVETMSILVRVSQGTAYGIRQLPIGATASPWSYWDIIPFECTSLL